MPNPTTGIPSSPILGRHTFELADTDGADAEEVPEPASVEGAAAALEAANDAAHGAIDELHAAAARAIERASEFEQELAAAIAEREVERIERETAEGERLELERTIADLRGQIAELERRTIAAPPPASEGLPMVGALLEQLAAWCSPDASGPAPDPRDAIGALRKARAELTAAAGRLPVIPTDPEVSQKVHVCGLLGIMLDNLILYCAHVQQAVKAGEA